MTTHTRTLEVNTLDLLTENRERRFNLMSKSHLQGSKPKENERLREVHWDNMDSMQSSARFERIKFNATSLDKLTAGGIDLKTITEFYGKGGSGKTQLCLQLALNCLLPQELGGAGGKVIYISSDKRFPLRRLLETTAAYRDKAPHINFLNKMFLVEFNTTRAFHLFVTESIHKVLVNGGVKLLVIDSIAGIYRTMNYKKRNLSIRKTFEKLMKLAIKHNFAIVTTNHMTSMPGLGSSDGIDLPAIGKEWSSRISTRLYVTKTDASIKVTTDTQNYVDTAIRQLNIIKSPRLAHSSAYFVITSRGVESVRRKDSE